MKDLLRKAFSPILDTFEQGEEAYTYKKSHRVILIVISVLFCILATAVAVMAKEADNIGYYIPTVVFGLVSFTTLVVGALGTDKGVASIWGSK